MKRLTIATPAFGGVVFAKYMISVIQSLPVLQSHGWDVTLDIPCGESLIPRGRNQVVHNFLKRSSNPDDRLMFVDADIEFPSDAIAFLASHSHDVCGLAYPRKQLNWDNIKKAVLAGENPELNASDHIFNPVMPTDPGGALKVEGGFVDVAHLGTGFLMFTRKALMDLVCSRPEGAHISDSFDTRGETVHDIFTCPIWNRRYLSEDWSICQQWLDLGGSVKLFLGGNLGHVGSYTFRADVMANFERGEAA